MNSRSPRRIKELADVIVIDEAHHFRNPGLKGDEASRSRITGRCSISATQVVFLLTATPINNRLTDFRHMVELFSRRDDYFSSDAWD